MKQTHSPNGSTGSLVCILLSLVIFVNGTVSYINAQCSTLDTQKFPRDSTIYINFGNITDPTQRQRITDAITKWNAVLPIWRTHQDTDFCLALHSAEC